MRTYWFEVAVVASVFAVGNILLGHFEERTPKWRRVAKFVGLTALAVGVSAALGRGAFFALLGAAAAAIAVVHGWWLPRQGVHGCTGEPRERYYRLRGWTPAGPGGTAPQTAARPPHRREEPAPDPLR